jgi:hypothetical protein
MENVIVLRNYERIPVNMCSLIYLAMSFAYEQYASNEINAKSLLSILEFLYADFDYPKEMKAFIRYMPSEGPFFATVEENEFKMIEDLRNYLDSTREIHKGDRK